MGEVECSLSGGGNSTLTSLVMPHSNPKHIHLRLLQEIQIIKYILHIYTLKVEESLALKSVYFHWNEWQPYFLIEFSLKFSQSAVIL